MAVVLLSNVQVLTYVLAYHNSLDDYGQVVGLNPAVSSRQQQVDQGRLTKKKPKLKLTSTVTCLRQEYFVWNEWNYVYSFNKASFVPAEQKSLNFPGPHPSTSSLKITRYSLSSRRPSYWACCLTKSNCQHSSASAWSGKNSNPIQKLPANIIDQNPSVWNS